RPMDEVQIHIVEPEAAKARIEGPERTLVAVFAQPEFGRDEHFGAIDSAAHEPFAHLSLVEIGSGGVDEPIARGDRCLDRSRGQLPGLPGQDAEPEGRHRDAVVQSQEGTPRGHEAWLCMTSPGQALTSFTPEPKHEPTARKSRPDSLGASGAR